MRRNPPLRPRGDVSQGRQSADVIDGVILVFADLELHGGAGAEGVGQFEHQFPDIVDLRRACLT